MGPQVGAAETEEETLEDTDEEGTAEDDDEGGDETDETEEDDGEETTDETEEDGAMDDDADDDGALGLHLDAAARPVLARMVARTEVIFILIVGGGC